ncbi:MAG: helix-turn-helix transcriptional regulator [Rhizobiales bacterium 17-65-6]|nr:MAG: helix-turn-helix transcriptional regulator [Rhizobiales bacterium 17-65-6]
MLNDVVSFDFSTIFAYPFGRRPIFLHDGYQHHASPQALDAYLGGTYLLDPFYTACVHGHAPGLWRMAELAPDDFFASDFFNSAEVHPCVSMEPGALVEEIGFIVPLRGGSSAVYSLMRMKGHEPFRDEDLAALRATEPVVRQTLRSHFRSLEEFPLPRQTLMEAAFERFCESSLTHQQRRIVQLILRGHSSTSIAEILELSEGTVKIHRKNIYRRLNISSQTELFNLFIQDMNRQPAMLPRAAAARF